MKDDIELMIDDCIKRERRLNQWEVEFIYSIKDQLNDSGFLFSKQLERLDSIWERVT